MWAASCMSKISTRAIISCILMRRSFQPSPVFHPVSFPPLAFDSANAISSFLCEDTSTGAACHDEFSLFISWNVSLQRLDSSSARKAVKGREPWRKLSYIQCSPHTSRLQLSLPTPSFKTTAARQRVYHMWLARRKHRRLVSARHGPSELPRHKRGVSLQKYTHNV